MKNTGTKSHYGAICLNAILQPRVIVDYLIKCIEDWLAISSGMVRRLPINTGGARRLPINTGGARRIPISTDGTRIIPISTDGA